MLPGCSQGCAPVVSQRGAGCILSHLQQVPISNKPEHLFDQRQLLAVGDITRRKCRVPEGLLHSYFTIFLHKTSFFLQNPLIQPLPQRNYGYQESFAKTGMSEWEFYICYQRWAEVTVGLLTNQAKNVFCYTSQCSTLSQQTGLVQESIFQNI